ncbi:MAG: hypothetical protein K9H25_15045 [Rhodospirillum sp.]|nr:hypothetical protein [Rhodospirillum sp.]MCF8491047.1 hypothetical protein [Rhodospirillum sp.]MCF8500370.1 hypothetical protein [Rhodospirillum sp.]
MTVTGAGKGATIALSTTLEKDFISPITAVRGALEILRDHADLTEEERLRFVNSALAGCARLEHGISHLSESVYAASKRQKEQEEKDKDWLARIHFLDEPGLDVVEVDFSDVVFSDTEVVTAFHDVVDRTLEATGKRWFIIVNFKDCKVWPEAWVAFAHRGKKTAIQRSSGVVRFGEPPGPVSSPNECADRDAALARVRDLAKETGAAR